MDPFRYPRIEFASGLEGEALRKALYSNLAERLAIERLYVAQFAEAFCKGDDLLSEAAGTLDTMVAKLRDAEAAIASRHRSPADQEAGPLAPADDPVGATGEIAASLRSFGRCEIHLSAPVVPFSLTNFYDPEMFGRWTGPGQLSSFGIDLRALQETGLKFLEIEFPHNLGGEVRDEVCLLVGEKLEPIDSASISWPTRTALCVSSAAFEGRSGDLYLLTRETRRVLPDTRYLGIAVGVVRFLA